MTSQAEIFIPAPALRDFAAALLAAGGFTLAEAARTAESLVLSNMRGYDSHGVMRVTEYIASLKKNRLASGAALVFSNDLANSLAADGGRGLGQVQMPLFLDRLLEKSRDNGVVSGALCNCGHVGRLGEWADYIARQGRAGFVFANDNGALYFVAPPGGRAGRTSTNPVAFGVPLANGAVFTLDMSTSAAAMGKIRLAYISGARVEEHVVQDAAGQPTTDPAVMFQDPKGSLLPFGGYKGFGLSMMVDCLVAGLSGGFAPPAPEEAPPTNNVLATIWNPEKFSGLAHMREQAEKYLAFVRATPPIDPAHPVRVAGDGAIARKERRAKDGIPVSAGSAAALRRQAEKLGVAVPTGFENVKFENVKDETL